MSYSLYLFELNSIYHEHKLAQIQQCLSDIEFCDHCNISLVCRPGPRLMEYINFLGCSPSLSSGEIESSLYLHGFKFLTGLGGESIETLRYPVCKHPVDNPAHLLASISSKLDWTCPECGNQGKIEGINWRKSAGISCFFIEISHIFPKEAIPNDSLLQKLNQCTDSRWSWFYSRSSQVSA